MKQSREDMLVRLLHHLSVKMMKGYSGQQELVVEAMNSDFPVKGHWMSVILISGKILRIYFKAHYFTRYSSGFASGIYQPDQITPFQLNDFFKEYCNLVAGSTKQALAENGIPVGISLPFTTRGFDEVFLGADEHAEGFTSHWTIESPTAKIACSMVVDALSNKWDLNHTKLNLSDHPGKLQ